MDSQTYVPLLGNADHRPRYAWLAEAFLQGYETERPLPGQWEQMLTTYLAARFIDLIAWIAFTWPRPTYRSWGHRACNKRSGH